MEKNKDYSDKIKENTTEDLYSKENISNRNNLPEKEKSFKETRIRSITKLYYSRPDIQKAIFDFCKNREICPRYFEGFGKRPDSFEYPGDVFELVKRGATSFHCSEEIWENPLNIQTGMTPEKFNEIRTGWDLLIDIDCKWFEYSKRAAKAIIDTLKNNKIKNIGIKFSGSKGFHIIVPWKAFPKEINETSTKDLFPDLPRNLVNYLRFESEKIMRKNLPEDFYKHFEKTDLKKGIKCNNCGEISDEYKLVEFYCSFCKSGERKKMLSNPGKEEEKQKNLQCPHCKRPFTICDEKDYYECSKCKINSNNSPENFSNTLQVDLFDLMGLDIVLVSPRHLFRTPYSLHEKTSLASIVFNESEVLDFEIRDADPMKINKDSIKDFLPDSYEEEAKNFVLNALDWIKEEEIRRGDDFESSEKITGKYSDFKPIELENLSEEHFPPCIQNILKGINDGRKRALFVLINLFRSVGMQKELLEKKIYEWNNKNPIPLKEGYIKSQLSWTYKRKPLMPPNCRDFYQGLGVCIPDNLCSSIKNPVNYTIKKNLSQQKSKKKINKKSSKKQSKNPVKDNFKKNN